MSIKIEKLWFRFSSEQPFILKDVNLNVQNEKTVAILGVSGSGKSTLLNLISSFYKPEKGKIEISPFLSNKISYIRQASLDMVFPWKTVYENMEFSLKERNISSPQNENRINEILKILELENFKHKYPNDLSGGQKKRLSLGCGLSYMPKLILIDEVFTGIDFSLKWKLWSYLKKEIKNLKATVILTTHDFDEAIYLADEIIFLNSNGETKNSKITIENKEWADIEKVLASKDYLKIKEEILSNYKSANEK